MHNTKLIATRAYQISAQGGFDPQNTDPIPSPCVSICRMTADGGHCEGCFRTLADIAIWANAHPAQRRHIWAQALARAGVALPPGLDGV